MVKAASAVAKAGYYTYLMVKTSYIRLPKKWLEETMKNYLEGTWIASEIRVEKKEVDMVAVDYKFNKKKALTFVLEKGVGASTEGDHYEIRFPEEYGNIYIHYVACPQMVSNYFGFSKYLDMYNQAR